MAVIFSIGFVIEGRPKKYLVAECATLYTARNVDVTWRRNTNCDCGGGCHACIDRGAICAPQGDDTRVVFSVYDEDGDEYDLTGVQEIVFAAANTKDGPAVFVKRLSLGEIILSGNGYQFNVDIAPEDVDLLTRVKAYYEVQVTTSTGFKKTVSLGILRTDKTIIKDIP